MAKFITKILKVELILIPPQDRGVLFDGLKVVFERSI
jgi:hypothetical protein